MSLIDPLAVFAACGCTQANNCITRILTHTPLPLNDSRNCSTRTTTSAIAGPRSCPVLCAVRFAILLCKQLTVHACRLAHLFCAAYSRCSAPVNQVLDSYLNPTISNEAALAELKRAAALYSAAQMCSLQSTSDSNAEEEQLLWQCVSIRMKHMPVYELSVLSAMVALFNISLVNQSLEHGLFACERICHKYSFVYATLGQHTTEHIQQQQQESTQAGADSVAPLDTATLTAHQPLVRISRTLTLYSLTIHPLLGLKLYSLVSLYEAGEQFIAALNALTAAQHILQYTHGKQHPMLTAIAEQMQDMSAQNR